MSDTIETRDALPPTTLADTLVALHTRQQRAVEKVGLDVRTPRPKTLAEFFPLSTETIRAVIPTFQFREEDAGSWVADHSLPLQLITQSHLTVDLTVAELSKKRPFGIPFDSLLLLADEGHLSLNFRDFDSEKSNGFLNYCGPLRDRVERLIAEVPGRIYFGSALRKTIFDTALRCSGYSESYEELYVEATRDLAHALEVYKQLDPNHEISESARFRGEKPFAVAACWHWAFLKSMSHFLPPSIMQYDGSGRLNQLYTRAKELSAEAASKGTEEADLIAARALVQLKNDLRIAHLNFTAPITAAYGKVFNMNDDEFESSRRLGRYWGPTPSKMLDPDHRRLLWFALNEKEGMDPGLYAKVRELPEDASLKLTLDDNAFTAGMVDALILALRRNRERIKEAAGHFAELKARYLSSEKDPAPVIKKLIEAYQACKSADFATVKAALKDDFEVVAAEGTNAGSPLSVWFEAAYAESREGVEEGVLLRPAEHRAIFRVYHAFNRGSAAS